MPIDYERDGSVAWLTLNRPEVLNALDSGMRAALHEAVERFNADAVARVLVITGAGDRAFCAGVDVKEMARAQAGQLPDDYVPQFGTTVDVPKPTVAAVNGLAYGAGFLLAQNCDLCIASERATFAIPEAKIGRGAPWAHRLPWLIPPRLALELLMTGEPIDAHRAERCGLANVVVPHEQLTEAVRQVAERIASNAPLSVMASKAMVSQTWSPSAQTVKDIATLWGRVYDSEDAKEGPTAFQERRAPRWKGR